MHITRILLGVQVHRKHRPNKSHMAIFDSDGYFTEAMLDHFGELGGQYLLLLPREQCGQ